MNTLVRRVCRCASGVVGVALVWLSFGVSSCASNHTLVQWERKEYTPLSIVDSAHTCELVNTRHDAHTFGEYDFMLRKVDGVGTSSMVKRDQLVHLNPGKHVIEIEFGGGQYGGGTATVTFVAEAGHQYAADGVSDPNHATMWIKDAASGQKVSNEAELSLKQLPWPIFTGK